LIKAYVLAGVRLEKISLKYKDKNRGKGNQEIRNKKT
jgi:hypothetical protein